MRFFETIARREDENLQEIVLYPEGLFYKAYERSAFACVSRVSPFKASKKRVKYCGRDMVSIGFPAEVLTRYFPGAPQPLPDGRVVIELAEPIDPAACEAWKNILPLKERQPRGTHQQLRLMKKTEPMNSFFRQSETPPDETPVARKTGTTGAEQPTRTPGGRGAVEDRTFREPRIDEGLERTPGPNEAPGGKGGMEPYGTLEVQESGKTNGLGSQRIGSSEILYLGRTSSPESPGLGRTNALRSTEPEGSELSESGRTNDLKAREAEGPEVLYLGRTNTPESPESRRTSNPEAGETAGSEFLYLRRTNGPESAVGPELRRTSTPESQEPEESGNSGIPNSRRTDNPGSPDSRKTNDLKAREAEDSEILYLGRTSSPESPDPRRTSDLKAREAEGSEVLYLGRTNTLESPDPRRTSDLKAREAESSEVLYLGRTNTPESSDPRRTERPIRDLRSSEQKGLWARLMRILGLRPRRTESEKPQELSERQVITDYNGEALPPVAVTFVGDVPMRAAVGTDIDREPRFASLGSGADMATATSEREEYISDRDESARSSQTAGGDNSSEDAGNGRRTEANKPRHSVPGPEAWATRLRSFPAGASDRKNERVVRLIREFRLEAATPVECVLFVADLKREIDGYL